MKSILNPATAIIIFGSVIIIMRAPLIFVPDSTRDFYLRLMSTNNRVRLVGLGFTLLGAIMIVSGRGGDSFAAAMVLVSGCFVFFMSLLGFVLLASVTRVIARGLLEGMDPLMRRALGLASVWFGGLMVYIGWRLMQG